MWTAPYLRWSRGLSARRARRTKSGPEGPPTRSRGLEGPWTSSKEYLGWYSDGKYGGYTGSFRRKTVFTGIIFHKSWVFSSVFLTNPISGRLFRASQALFALAASSQLGQQFPGSLPPTSLPSLACCHFQKLLSIRFAFD